MRLHPYCPQGVFAVIDAGGAQVARLSSGVYAVTGDTSPGYRDKVREEGGHVLLCGTGSKPYGVIEGLTLTLDSGQVLTLRALSEETEAGKVRRLDDADAFRAALVRLELAAEQGETGERIERLRRRVMLATFYRCPACGNQSEWRTDCELCGGDGFVYEGVA